MQEDLEPCRLSHLSLLVAQESPWHSPKTEKPIQRGKYSYNQQSDQPLTSPAVIQLIQVHRVSQFGFFEQNVLPMNKNVFLLMNLPHPLSPSVGLSHSLSGEVQGNPYTRIAPTLSKRTPVTSANKKQFIFAKICRGNCIVGANM